MKFTELMWPRDGKEKKCRVPPPWLQVYSWVSALTIFIQHDYLLRNFFFLISSVSCCQLTQSFIFFKPMIHSIHLEGSLKSYLRECILWFALCKYDSHKRFLFCLYIYSLYLFCFSVYKVLLFCFYSNRFNPTKDQVKISWVLYWTEALINTWKCIQSRSAARVKIFQWKEASAEKKKAKKWTICWWLHTFHWRDIFILSFCRVF